MQVQYFKGNYKVLQVYVKVLQKLEKFQISVTLKAFVFGWYSFWKMRPICCVNFKNLKPAYTNSSILKFALLKLNTVPFIVESTVHILGLYSIFPTFTEITCSLTHTKYVKNGLKLRCILMVPRPEMETR